MQPSELLNKGTHPAFTTPVDPEIKIWRYMDFTQFVSMVEEKGLLFTRADLFDDKFEGTMSQPLYDFLERNGDARDHASLLRLTKNWSFVSCWHMNECESSAMWKIYSSAKESVCIQSTYAKLRTVLAEDVYIGVVEYISYQHDKIPAGNTFWPLMRKRRSFEHEKELRAVWSAWPNEEPVAYEEGELPQEHERMPERAPGENVWKPVDLTALVERIFVSPTAKPWFLELVKRVLKTYGLASLPVQQSDLAAEPLFY
jgi:hypothetical protein